MSRPAGPRPDIEHHAADRVTTRPVVSGTQGVVAAGHPLVAMAGMRMLLGGGNAFDAAVAAGFAAAVVEPTASYTLMGECVALVHEARSRRTLAVSGQGTAPALATIGAFSGRGLDRIPTGPGSDAHLSFTVPGAVDAYLTLLETLGTKTLPEVLEPAVGYARRGFPVYEFLHRMLDQPATRAQFAIYPPGGEAVFYPGGRVPPVGALLVHFRNWVMKGTPPPQSVYPTLAAGTLVDPTKKAMGFPTIPGLPKGAPTGFMNTVLDYDYGPDFNYADGTGVMTKVPPAIKHVIKMKVPKVDADGNEQGGVPVVLRDAPLGTYLGWNITAAGFHKGQICNYAGGMIPFAKTKAERMANEDPRLSLEERYGSHDGYVQVVKTAAQKIVAAGFLLQADADAMIDAAEKSNVLR